MMNKKALITIFIGFLLCSSVLFIGYKTTKAPVSLYRVYLDGKSIGYIESKEELEAYIDQAEAEIKDQYGVDKVYLPNNLDIEKQVTYSKNVSSVEDIYEKIKDIAPFTINGYQVKIKGVEQTDDETGVSTTKTIVFNILDKNVFTNSIDTTIKAFINEEEYEAYKNNLQNEIETTGKIIENVYIKNEITIKQANISVEDKIFTDADELSKYLLFGENSNEKEYIVKSGETIEEIAFNNKMSSNEFLVANPSLTSEDNLLYIGQKVNVATIDPAFKVVEDDYVVELQKIEYNTIYKDDKTMYKGTEKVSQAGKDGSAKVAYNIIKENGETIDTETQNTEILSKSVDRIILRGTKQRGSGGGGGGGTSIYDGSKTGAAISGTWFWPTQKPYRITSKYGYRGGKLHAAVDIQSTAVKYSKIYASNNGVVWKSGWSNTGGNEIIIKHSNGYYTTYCHLSKRYVKAGDVVTQGQVLGVMGQTGLATGVHLHFGVWNGKPYYSGSKSYDPMKTLRFR